MTLRDPLAYGPRPADQDAPAVGTVTVLTAEDLTGLGRMGTSSTTMFRSVHADRDAAKAAAEIHYGNPIDWRPRDTDPDGPETSGDLRHVLYTVADVVVLDAPPVPESTEQAAARASAEEVRATLVEGGVADEVIERVMAEIGRPTPAAAPATGRRGTTGEGLYVLRVNNSVDGRGPTITRGYFTDPDLALEAGAAFGADMGGSPYAEVFRVDNVNEGVPTRYDPTSGESYAAAGEMMPSLTPIRPAR